MAENPNQIEPIIRISNERIKHVATILEGAQHETTLVQKRLGLLAQELDHLLIEIEMFGTVVYCGQAAACLLNNNVLRVLAGSMMWGRTPGRTTRISKDEFWHAPSPAAVAALGRNANGLVEWKDRGRRSIKTLQEKKWQEAKAAEHTG